MYLKTLPILLLFACLCWFTPAQAVPGARVSDDLPPVLLEHISVALDPDEQSNGESHAPMLSGDGRLVVFLSLASNLVEGDNNGLMDVFVYDRNTDLVELASIGFDGAPADGVPSRPSISSDGRYVVFESTANNLVEGDTPDLTPEVFLFDRLTRKTEFISLTSEGEQIEQDAFSRRPAISADGRYVVFYSNAQALSQGAAEDTLNIYLRDREAGLTTLLTRGCDDTPANGDSTYPTLSDDGKWAAYYSDAINLVEGDTNVRTDVFLYSIEQDMTWRVSVASDGSQANGTSYVSAISADGRYVAFESSSTNLVEGDGNGAWDIFVHDQQTGLTELVSRTWNGSLANADSFVPSISADGRYVAFYSNASNLVLGDTNQYADVFRHDRLLHTTVRVSLGDWLQQGDNHSQCSSISQDGQEVAFYSYAENLVVGDTNGVRDVYLRDFSLPPPDYSVRLPLILK